MSPTFVAHSAILLRVACAGNILSNHAPSLPHSALSTPANIWLNVSGQDLMS